MYDQSDRGKRGYLWSRAFLVTTPANNTMSCVSLRSCVVAHAWLRTQDSQALLSSKCITSFLSFSCSFSTLLTSSASSTSDTSSYTTMLQKRICSSNIYYKDLLTLLRTPSSPFNHSVITRSYQTSKPTIESTSKETTNSPQHEQKDKAPATTNGSNTRNSTPSQHKTNKDVTQITNEQIKLFNEKLHIHKLEDWYEVPIRQIKTVIGDVAVLHMYLLSHFTLPYLSSLSTILSLAVTFFD